jgi:hypothetical protein
VAGDHRAPDASGGVLGGGVGSRPGYARVLKPPCGSC